MPGPLLKHSSKPANPPAPCFPALYVKGIAELELENFEESFWEECGGVFLVQPDVRESMSGEVWWMQEQTRLVDFDPSHDDLGEILKK